MRAELLGLVLAFSAGAGAACPQVPVVFAQAGAGRFGSRGPYEKVLRFHLDAPDRVWAEAEGLAGLFQGDRDDAPEVFLDDTYLGPLLADFGTAWRSPEALRLEAGDHEFLVRSAQPGEGPLLRWDSLRVLGDAPCRPTPKASKLQDSWPCDKLVSRRDWPARLHGGELILPLRKGRFVGSGRLIRLKEGEVWSVRMRIPEGPHGQPLPLEVRIETPKPGQARFLIWVDPRPLGPVGAVGYIPGSWQSFSLALCSGALRLRFAKEPPLGYAFHGSAVSFAVACRDLELALSPQPDASAHN